MEWLRIIVIGIKLLYLFDESAATLMSSSMAICGTEGEC